MFDKKAYNREYYRRHKDLWEKYRDGSGAVGKPDAAYIHAVPRSSTNMNSRYGEYGREMANYQATKSIMDKYNRAYNTPARHRYGEYGRNKAQEERKKLYKNKPYLPDGRVNPDYIPAVKRTGSNMNSRYGEYGKAKAAEMAKKRTTSGMNYRYSWKNHGLGMAQEEVRKRAKDIQDVYKRQKNTDAYRRVQEDIEKYRRKSRQSEYAKAKAQEEARKQKSDKKATKIRTVKTAAKKAANAYKKAMKMLFG